ncbi:monofunctional biosynthetic peptidoglycan transglycosylase [Pseudooceanicola algae]|uniref:monofunctional biosynthetic peptidoglycan transglycosylase n=1 Tax=Pseudooceanicola algae TaxID=1537215 RepID=UPI000E6D55B8
MARAAKQSKNTGKKSSAKGAPRRRIRPFRWLLGHGWRLVLILLLAFLGIIALHGMVKPWGGIYMASEARRLGGVERQWVAMEEIAPVMARSVVAAEDANFCLHWGVDMSAIRDAIADGGQRGGSTISQQVVKNVYLWHGRTYTRKAMETVLTPVVEAFWSKRRVLEVYLNIAEFDEGVFGVEAAGQHYFGVDAADLSARQAALMAAILPSPQSRSASNPGEYTRRRANAIQDGAATIQRDGRADCFSG